MIRTEITISFISHEPLNPNRIKKLERSLEANICDDKINDDLGDVSANTTETNLADQCTCITTNPSGECIECGNIH
jgi:hypothetical protein